MSIVKRWKRVPGPEARPAAERIPGTPAPPRPYARVPAALLLGIVAAAAAFAAPDARAQTSGVRLNEILADPASDWDGDGTLSSRDDEWVEVVNAGSSAVDLSQFRISGADTCWRFAFSGSLGPEQVAVVYGSESYAWEDATGNPRYGLRLGNTGGTVLLWRLSGPDTTLVDAYTYQDHEADDDRSTGRAPDGADTWRLFDALNPFTGTEVPEGTNCMPSPGARLSCPTPVDEKTWGEIKKRFR